MFSKLTLSLTLALIMTLAANAQENDGQKIAELDVVKQSIGVWEAKVEVWPQGLDSPSVTFTGTETNRAYGRHWLASDFESEFGGQTQRVHSIIGYDLDKKMLVGTVIDDGPYAASMTGDYDEESKTVHWTTRVKSPSGKPIVQKTSMTQKSNDKRYLVPTVPEKDDKEKFNKFMEIIYTRKK